MDKIPAELYRTAKKQKQSRDAIIASLDGIISSLKETKQGYVDQIDVPNTEKVPTSKQFSALYSQVSDSISSINQSHKEFHSSLSDFSKTIEKAFPADLDRLKSSSSLDSNALHTAIAQHLLREGLFSSIECLSSELQSQSTPSSSSPPSSSPSPDPMVDSEPSPFILPLHLIDPIRNLYAIIDQIQSNHDVGPAIQWCTDQHSAPPSLITDIEFRLHKLRYIDLVQEGKRDQATLYVRTHLSRFANTKHARDFTRLMGMIMYSGRLESSPYKDLLIESHGLEQTLSELKRVAFSIMGLPVESPLIAAIEAGTIALPTLLKMSALLASKGQDWTSEDQLPIEIELGPKLRFHSIFACPVSREPSTPENPPTMLPCGHVLCKQSMMRLMRGNSIKAKCPYCPVDFMVSQTREIKF